MSYVVAIDQGTTSSRCFVFDDEGAIVAFDQREHRQIFPQPGWVEHDPSEIWHNVQAVIEGALAKAGNPEVKAVGITNQRETTLIWDAVTGEPIGNAIVWQDTRTAGMLADFGDIDTFRDRTGLPLATYFSAPKLRWLLAQHQRKSVLAGTMDSWLIYKLTGRHATDVTNASRTLLMNLSTLDWDDSLLQAFGVQREILPDIVPSSGEIAEITSGPLRGVPVAGVLGDQQAALMGQACFEPGEAKCTYGTGAFLLLNTGEQPIASHRGLVTTVAYQRAGRPAVYALEGSVAVAGALVQWLRDNLGIIRTADEVNVLAASVPDNGGCHIVPAFSGLFAPFWRPEARGVICGLTGYVTKAHLARAALEATAWQVHDVVSVMAEESGTAMEALNVDGGMTASDLLLQIQADLLGVPVIRPTITETTVLGAAYAAGLASGVWPDEATLRDHWKADRRWEPSITDAQRARAAELWQRAVAKTSP
ncbi:MAG TPA: glycerol kinase, partial [Micromonosporaceae bacterium]|nr:glycerol kinase [Micromonosporaceae bacterium]